MDVCRRTLFSWRDSDHNWHKGLLGPLSFLPLPFPCFSIYFPSTFLSVGVCLICLKGFSFPVWNESSQESPTFSCMSTYSTGTLCVSGCVLLLYCPVENTTSQKHPAETSTRVVVRYPPQYGIFITYCKYSISGTRSKLLAVFGKYEYFPPPAVVFVMPERLILTTFHLQDHWFLCKR